MAAQYPSFEELPLDKTGPRDVSAKGIAGRAVFIDWYSWALAQGLEIDAMSSYESPFEQIVKTLEFQNMSLESLQAGDIIVIRFEYMSQYEDMNAAKREYLDKLYQTQKPQNIGLKPSEELLRFLWNTKIAAICGDARSLEVWPCNDLEWHLYEWLLAGWGMPIGELFYLEELTKTCKTLERYTFFMLSLPMNVPGAVASPPNALAFF
ncbi:hypothetical protein H9Q72_013894 [Fusarium xylarioides]|uniref:Cyclase n=1 Tax=Fusarium xylarioides TaxID=221167 RepID=A0A9P7HEN5_9HYPO|nr:hypothetical protein H9Q72_013894 [Fusarium xylarioides]